MDGLHQLEIVILLLAVVLLLTAERFRLIQLRNEGTIGDEVLHRLEHELDVEAPRAGINERRLPR